MHILNVIKQHSDLPIIVTAEAITATEAHNEYNAPGTHCLFEDKEHVIVRGCACGSHLPGIAIGSQMLMELEPA